MNTQIVNVIGAGLAGSEAAWQLARRGVRVRLHEMRPVRKTEAHQTSMFAELVCSNSLRGASLETAVGVLKEEMRRLGSLVIAAADKARVPAGGALAVDREGFSRAITDTLSTHPLIDVAREEVVEIPDGPAIIATGPLTSDALGERLNQLIGPRNLYFYDAIAPIIARDSIDMDKAFLASRYGKGGDDYINCPLNEAEYEAFIDAVIAADKVALHPFEKAIYFEGCMPIEEMARRGRQTLSFGPMKPVGIVDPRSGQRPFAVVQLRQDDSEGRLYNMVGFQTKMTYPAQRQVLRMIPGLARAEFVRLGSLHRNTFIDSPRLLRPTLQLKSRDDLFMAGQMIGVEGYVESAAAGLLAAINVARLARGNEAVFPPPETALGSLVAYVTNATRRDFQPMNANYGLMPELAGRMRGREKKIEMGNRALHAIDQWIAANSLEPASAAALGATAAGLIVKLATFDIGTNTVLMLAVELESGKPKTLLERSRITRLGKGVERTGALDKETSQLTLDTIAEFAAEARAAGAGKIIAAATSALRDASNGADFISRVKAKAGVDLKVIPGLEEAELSRLAVQRSLNLDPSQRLLIADIGGGSTELIRSEPGHDLASVSLQIGSVRLTERIIEHDPPSPEEIAKLTATIDEQLEKLGWSFRPEVMVGIAGTVTTIAAVALKMRDYEASRVQGHQLSHGEVEAIVKRFGAVTLAERKKIPGVLEARADVIFAGSMILARIMNHFKLGHVIVSDQGVRWGLVWRELDRESSNRQ